MSRMIEFTVSIEVDEDDEISLDMLDEALGSMEEIVAKNNWSLFDSNYEIEKEPEEED